MKKSKSLYHGQRFPAEVISCAVRWSFRLQLSLLDIEELLCASLYRKQHATRFVAWRECAELDQNPSTTF
jgi:transposase-like protein